MDRRTFLKSSMAAAAAFIEVPRLAKAKESGGLIQMTGRPLNYESPRSTFTTRITPLEKFYLRNHFDVPQVDAKAWRLKIGGLVEKPVELSLAQLERMPQTTVEAVLQCAGNGRGLFVPQVPGVQWRYGAMGNAEWSGVRVKDVLALAAPKADAAFLQMQGVEKPPMTTTPAFIRAIPMEKALHPDTLIALRQNGRPLAPNRGFPARMVVPGWVGDDWVRFIGELELRADEPAGFYYNPAYRFPQTPGAPGAAIPPEQMKPLTRTNVKSIVGSIGNGDQLHGPQKLAGVAFSGDAGIAKVELSFDGGATWTNAELDRATSPYGFRAFHFEWKPAPGKYTVACRATDANGAVQPEAPVWNPGGFLYNAIDRVSLEVL